MAKFERELDISADLEGFTKESRDRLAIAIDMRVVRETPKDTGAAAGDWLASTSGAENSGSAVIPAGQATTAAISAIKAAKAYDTLYITNAKPYIVPLNEGWSQQAPSRYVDTIIEQEVARANR